jgi:hypothetical protein
MFEFRPEFHIDLKLDVVWPKLKGAFKGIASAFRGLVLPGEGRGGERRNGRRGSRRRARLVGWCLAALFIAAALLAAILLTRH